MLLEEICVYIYFALFIYTHGLFCVNVVRFGPSLMHTINMIITLSYVKPYYIMKKFYNHHHSLPYLNTIKWVSYISSSSASAQPKHGRSGPSEA